MPGATTNYAIPYPLLTDPADIETDGVKDTADAIDLLLAGFVRAGTTPPAVGVPAQQAWQTIALTNFTGNLSYYKDSLGIVHFRGNLLTTSSAVASNAVLCTLPAGYRPGVLITLPLPSLAAAGPYNVQIDTTGVVRNPNASLQIPTGQSYSFGNMHYRAEN